VPAPLEGPALARPIRVAMTLTVPGAEVHPAVADAVRRAAGWLADAGYAVEAVEPPDLAEAAQLWDTLAQGEAIHFVQPAVEQFGDWRMKKAFEGMSRRTPRLAKEDFLRALARRTTLIRNWQRFLQAYPLVLGPISAEPPFPYGLDVDDEGGFARVFGAQAPQFHVPLLGLPAISAPAGLADGLPIGVQITGPRFREDLVLDAAEVVEGRCPAMTPIEPKW
jgi:amidase